MTTYCTAIPILHVATLPKFLLRCPVDFVILLILVCLEQLCLFFSRFLVVQAQESQGKLGSSIFIRSPKFLCRECEGKNMVAEVLFWAKASSPTAPRL